MALNERSLKALQGVHADLVKVAHAAHALAVAQGLDFAITEGLRTEARQRKLVASGVSTTMKSRHLKLIGHLCLNRPG